MLQPCIKKSLIYNFVCHSFICVFACQFLYVETYIIIQTPSKIESYKTSILSKDKKKKRKYESDLENVYSILSIENQIFTSPEPRLKKPIKILKQISNEFNLKKRETRYIKSKIDNS